MDGVSDDFSDSTQRPDSDNDQRVYFVPYRWWKDAQDLMPGDLGLKIGIVYTASPVSSYTGPMKLINNIFSLDLVFSLRKEDSEQGGMVKWVYPGGTMH
ncbi:ubiquitin carboxyl-terminal hydrolase 8-like [Juglans regia]|uniref:Ubiquitin carboxyl-terminal hydrolase 8-like n=1 Tax=Juglans regia TaxID=51240 RepID=A0A6P9E3U7_JUGRE|nr:ubiquitin carboxyl-terminal hydrolase 8-like [Juglans regia]